MHRIKKSIFLLLAILCISTTTCFAYGIPRNDMAIGGIAYGTSMDYVKQIYGTPTKITYADGEWHTGKLIVYNYNDKFIVSGSVRTNTVVSIVCTEKGLSTPGGLAVGMKYDIVKKIYGNGGRMDLLVKRPSDGYKYYYYSNATNEIQFIVDKQGIIQKIFIYNAA